MITERTLKRWRKDALKRADEVHSLEKGAKLHGHQLDISVLREKENHDRIIRLTGELLDQHLLRER